MPLLVPVSVETPPPAPAPTPRRIVRPPRLRTVMTLTDPAGKVWHLTDGVDGMYVMPGRRGFHAPLYQQHEDESPAVDGSFFRSVRALPRELFIPIAFTADTLTELRTLRRSFIAAVSPKRGQCTYTEAQPDGERRHMACRYSSGMEGEEELDPALLHVVKYGLVLRALDPYWHGDETVITFRSGNASRTWLPIPGADGDWIVVSPSHVLGSTRVENVGDVEAYPVWKVSGPFTGITLVNDTTGKTLTLNTTAAATTDVVTIDTRRGEMTIVDETGANLWPDLADGSALWPLEPGVNEIQVDLTGTTEDTIATLTYQPRFDTP